MVNFDAVVIGGGAAGLFAAALAGKRGKRILVIERSAEPGRKILISGGGRCNFTNRNVSAENFVSGNPHFARSALARYTPQDFIALVEQHGIPYYEKKAGQLFCRRRSRDIVDLLLKECDRAAAGVKLLTACNVLAVEHDGKYRIETGRGCFEAEALIIASGGLSFPKVGATGIGYDIARHFGIEVIRTRPSLVPMRIAGGGFPLLAGISVEAVAMSGKAAFRENVLFTHRGLSGPAILQISNYWKASEPVIINFRPEINWLELLRQKQNLSRLPDNLLSDYLPAKFADFIVRDVSRRLPLNQLRKEELDAIAGRLTRWEVMFSDTEGYDRAEVTLGGISTNELNSKTMECRKQSGLFFIGEVVDVTGWLGGYNFQWAWSSANAAAMAL